MKTTVTKFGGTSLADAGQFRKVKAILEADPSRRYVVASAPGKRFSGDTKVTDLLLKCYEAAAAGKDPEPLLSEIRSRFESIREELHISYPLEEKMAVIRAHLLERPQRDYMASRGEYLNSGLLAAYLGIAFLDPAECVRFTAEGKPDAGKTDELLAEKLRDLPQAVIAGFYGADENGTVRTFSRGGSDISGSLVARAVHADVYENWTDVSGLLAADPRLIENPRTVDYMSYRELRTLSYMGASVLHTDAVLPAAEAGVSINIRNTNRPEDAGTWIVSKLPEQREKQAITGVAGRCGMSVIQVEKVMVSDGAGFSAILLDILKNRGIPFEQCLTGIDTVSLVIRSDLLEECEGEILDEIRETLRPDLLTVKKSLSMIAVVGEGDADATMRVLRAVSESGIEISTINRGAGSLNLIIGVPETRYADAVRAIYSMITE